MNATVQEESPGRVRLLPDEARTLSEAALRGAGWDAREAVLLADHMLDAALCGYEYSGLPKIVNIAQYRRKKPATGAMLLCHETPVSARFDARGTNGMLALHHATEVAIAKAGVAGFAVVGVSDSWMSGRGAYYAEMVARAGLVCIHTVSSRPQVAPPGGARAAIGTNPVTLGFPTAGDPLVIDMGTSALMFTDLALRERRGEPLPEGVAIDAEGVPTTDPARALLGAVLPFGGHKGFALGLGMMSLGVLAGAGSDGVGYLLIALRPDLMLPEAEYRQALSAALAGIKATPLQPGAQPIRIPSERGFAERRRNRVEGIVIDRDEYDALVKLAAGL